MADQRQGILDAISELETILAEMDSMEGAYQSGDMVNYSYDGREGIAVVESVSDDLHTVRVMAVAGDNYEPTDDVLVLTAEEISPMNGDPKQDTEGEESEENEEDVEEDEEKTEPDEDLEENEEEEDDDDEEEDFKKGVFVSWDSRHGKVNGKVVEVSTEDVVIPETGDVFSSSKNSPVALIEVYQDSDGWEDTGVHVAIPCKNLSIIDPLEVKQKKLLVKMKNYNLGTEEEGKIGTFDDIGSAYGKIDLGGDTVAKGAYTQTINHNNGKVPLMFDHGWKVSDAAGIAYVSDSEDGLNVKGRMPLHIQSVKDGFEMIKFMQAEGKPLGLSIGYFPVKSEPGPNGTRILKEIALEEMTITPWPMDTHARIRNAKERKNTYHSKRRGWQQLSKAKTPTDAPTGNQDCQDDTRLLDSFITEIKTQMEESC